jgi:hypothetical protein
MMLARLRVTVVDSDNLDEYKCVLMLNLFAESYNKTQSGNVYLMKYLCKSQLFNNRANRMILKNLKIPKG